MKRIVTRMSLLAASAILATGCVPVRHNLPPEQRLLEPGPGVGGPGPGVLGPPAVNPGMGGVGMAGMDGPGGVVHAGLTGMGPGCANVGSGPSIGDCLGNVSNIPPAGGVTMNGGMAGGCGMIGDGTIAAAPPTAQLTFGRPEGMYVKYDSTGGGTFDSEPLVVPARQNFPQGGLYRIKLTNITGREGVELYPTIELAYANPRTGAYLAHNSIPIQFTEEDFDQVLTGNFVTKVIYLPDPDFQGPALAGIDTLVSTRLDPGIDPIVEADRRGSILAIIRLGDKDIEMMGAGALGGGYAPPIAGLPAPFAPAMTSGCGGAGDCGASGGNMGPGGGRAGAGGNCAPLPMGLPGMVAGVTAPQYGMPMSGTPIGLPGPPHIPLGHPASLQKHTIKNHTKMHLPQPVENVKVGVRLQPGYSYPNPVSRIHIREQNIHPGVPNGRPFYQHHSQEVDPNCEQ